jgi:hypothetical protein
MARPGTEDPRPKLPILTRRWATRRLRTDKKGEFLEMVELFNDLPAYVSTQYPGWLHVVILWIAAEFTLRLIVILRAKREDVPEVIRAFRRRRYSTDA